MSDTKPNERNARAVEVMFAIASHFADSTTVLHRVAIFYNGDALIMQDKGVFFVRRLADGTLAYDQSGGRSYATLESAYDEFDRRIGARAD